MEASRPLRKDEESPGLKDENTEVLGSTMFGSGLSAPGIESQGCPICAALVSLHKCRGTLLGCHEEGWDRVCSVETRGWQPWTVTIG